VRAAHALPAVTLHTSIRVHDSLERGVSYFMAELERLKVIVDASRDRAIGTERTLLYLLDEILQGTNSAERTIAARRVISHLVEAGAIGAVTTHDLALATADGAGDPAAATVARAAVAVHFAEQFRDDGEPGPRMTFDYALRPGVATSTNALKLLEIVGLSA
jgi:DNA mismatch repair ATPase MutS